MGIEEFLDMMPHTITVEPFVSMDEFSRRTYGSPVRYRARVVGKNKSVTNFAGEEVISNVTAYIANSTGIKSTDRITLPAGFEPSQPPILSIERIPDENGLHHEVIYT